MTLPKPRHWRERPLLATIALAIGLAVAAVGMAWAVVVLGRGDYLTAVVTSGYAAAILCVVLSAARVRLGKVSARGTHDAHGTTVHIDRVCTWLMGAAALLVIPSGILFVVGALTDALDLPFIGAGPRLYLAIVMAFAVVGGITLLAAMISRGGLGHVRLTPTGFEIGELRRVEYGEWSDVRDVTDEVADKNAREPIVIDMSDGSSHVINVAGNYTPHGIGLYWMVRQYWRHPEQRADLTDGRAIRRLHDEEFDAK